MYNDNMITICAKITIINRSLRYLTDNGEALKSPCDHEMKVKVTKPDWNLSHSVMNLHSKYEKNQVNGS